ncbi:MAG: glycine cleavage system protein GcvH [Simkaniaceae bacterium]|nr:MAG: glycine cleavage system protein GcvH [Simkaniaceae bacterium]
MKYTDTHEWYLDGKVGISKYAQQELGEIVYIELPKVGQEVKAGEEIAVLESTKAAADIYSPISGTVTSVNMKLKEDVNLLNQFPEEEGYLFEIMPSHPEEIEALYAADDYKKLVLGFLPQGK